MGTNDPTKQNANSGSGIRGKVLRPMALLLALVVALLISRSRSHTPATQQTEAPATHRLSNSPTLSPKVIPDNKSLRPSQPGTEPETARLISVMSDKTLSLQLRRQAARSLAKMGTEEAMTALKAALADDLPPYLKAAIAEGLGESPNPEARDLLHELVNGKDETTARAAARGLALRGDADAVGTLGNLLFNDQTPLSVRSEAALGLGDVELPAALDLLTRAVTQIQDEDVLESVLDGLGRRPFSETQEFFRNYLNSPGVSADAKVLAIEAITDADGDVGPFLSHYLNDPNPDVRAAAQAALDFLGPIPPPKLPNAPK